MNLSRGDQKVWLVKLPRYLMDEWSNKETMNGQQLGNVKIRKDSKGKLQVKLVLSDDSSDKIPHDYDIKMLNTQVNNSYAFTEENLKKFKQELTEVSEMPEQPQLKDLNAEKKKFQPRRKFRYFRVQKKVKMANQLRNISRLLKLFPRRQV